MKKLLAVLFILGMFSSCESEVELSKCEKARAAYSKAVAVAKVVCPELEAKSVKLDCATAQKVANGAKLVVNLVCTVL